MPKGGGHRDRPMRADHWKVQRVPTVVVTQSLRSKFSRPSLSVENRKPNLTPREAFPVIQYHTTPLGFLLWSFLGLHLRSLERDAASSLLFALAFRQQLTCPTP